MFSNSALLMLLFVGLPVSAGRDGRPHYDAIFVFGDSYSDIGNHYVDGNGPTAAAYLAHRMGIDITYPRDTELNMPNSRAAAAHMDPVGPDRGTATSLDFAVSGARTGSGTGSLEDQANRFVARVHAGTTTFNPKTTLFFIAGGLNDGGLPTDTTLANLTRIVKILKDVGAQHFTVALMPTQIPAFSVVGRRLNPAYEQFVPKLRKSLGVDISLNHWGVYYDDVMAHPASYGITNTTDACAGRAIFGQDTTPCAKPDTYYYFHDGHPSTATHRIVGDSLYREIVGK